MLNWYSYGLSTPPVSGVHVKRVMPQHESAPSTKKVKGNETPKEPNKQDKALEETAKHKKMMPTIAEVKEGVEKEKAENRKKFIRNLLFLLTGMSFLLTCHSC